MNITVPILLLLGGVALQIFLSLGESRWPGLVLPALTLLSSLIAVLSLMAYASILQTIFTVLTVLLSANIPTIILLAIYFACRARRRHKHHEELEKMNIQDLD